MTGLLGVLVVWVPIVFALVVVVVGVLMLTVVLPPARAQVREQRMRAEIERRAAEAGDAGDTEPRESQPPATD